MPSLPTRPRAVSGGESGAARAGNTWRRVFSRWCRAPTSTAATARRRRAAALLPDVLAKTGVARPVFGWEAQLYGSAGVEEWSGPGGFQVESLSHGGVGVTGAALVVFLCCIQCVSP